jgi:hypothetical protein
VGGQPKGSWSFFKMPARKDAPPRLAGLPLAMRFESPASWVSRAALSQGETVDVLLAHMGLPKDSDIDLVISSRAGRDALMQCGVSEPFALARSVFPQIQKLGRSCEKFLLATRTGIPRYRFCAKCLATQSDPHFEVHCRFATWRFCPIHRCLLEDTCPHCKAFVTLPFSMLYAGPKKSGVAYLAHCQKCGGRLSSLLPVSLDSLPLTEWDWVLLKNGRAVLAALLHGVVRVDGEKKLTIANLRRLAKNGVLPLWADWMSADLARQAAAVLKTGPDGRETHDAGFTPLR